MDIAYPGIDSIEHPELIEALNSVFGVIEEPHLIEPVPTIHQ